MRLVATAGVVLMALTLPTRADDLVILSAAAVRPALNQLPALFEKSTGHRVTVSFGNATAVLKKVIGGERVDVVILPPRQLTTLANQGHVAADTRIDLGVVRLGVATREGSAALAMATAEQFKQALLAASTFAMPDPAGGSTSSQHLVKMMQQLGIAEAMRGKTRYFKDGTQALQAVAKGEIALTIAPTTSIRVVPGVQLAGALPDAFQSKTLYAAALARQAAGSESARALLTALRSSEFAAVMRDKGIDPP